MDEAGATPLTRRRSVTPWIAVAATVAAIGVCIAFVDLPLALYLKRTVSEPVFTLFYWICKLGEGGLWVAVALAIWAVPWARQWWQGSEWRAAARTTSRYGWQCGYLLAVLAINGVVVNILKHALGRYRPSKFFQTGEHEFSFFVIFQKSDSFPSGHAATIWGAMICLWFIYPRLRWLYVPLAIVVSLGRLIVHKHFLGDVVAGAALALAVALVLGRALERRHPGTLALGGR